MEFYGTIGPACKDTEILIKMFQKGMTGIRLNMSHSSLEDAKEWIANIHQAAKQCQVQAQLLMDLQGPELRIGAFAREGKYLLDEEEDIYLGIKQKEDQIPVTEEVLSVISPGQEILLDDGEILLKAEEVLENKVRCRILRGGILSQKKSIALPGVQMEIPTLRQTDIENIKAANAYGVTGVMLPFVRGSHDVRNLRQALQEAGAGHIRIYAKIENLMGVEALEEIIPETDMVVIARGDLGNALPLWELPALQKKIARQCLDKNCKFMVVTQMLASMEQAEIPTRAEVSDIFNAVLDGADAVMLTGETAIGSYPVEAMEYLVKTAKSALEFH